MPPNKPLSTFLDNLAVDAKLRAAFDADAEQVMSDAEITEDAKKGIREDKPDKVRNELHKEIPGGKVYVIRMIPE
jgi:hypothetical protein